MRRKIFLAAAALFLASCSKQKQVEPVIQVVRAGVVEEIRPGLRGAVFREHRTLREGRPGIQIRWNRRRGFSRCAAPMAVCATFRRATKWPGMPNWPRYVRSTTSMHSSRPRHSMRRRRRNLRRRRRNGRRRRRSLHERAQTSTRPKLNMYARLICSNRRAWSNNSTMRRRDAMKPTPQL